jgi:hypothetical protein
MIYPGSQVKFGNGGTNGNIEPMPSYVFCAKQWTVVGCAESTCRSVPGGQFQVEGIGGTSRLVGIAGVAGVVPPAVQSKVVPVCVVAGVGVLSRTHS